MVLATKETRCRQSEQGQSLFSAALSVPMPMSLISILSNPNAQTETAGSLQNKPGCGGKEFCTEDAKLAEIMKTCMPPSKVAAAGPSYSHVLYSDAHGAPAAIGKTVI